MSTQTEQDHTTDIYKVVVKNSPPTKADYAYRIGTMWLDTTNSRVYICIDNEAAGLAEWFQLNVDATIS